MIRTLPLRTLVASSCWIATTIPAVAVAATVCPGLSTLEGVDVSSYDGTVDWQRVAASKAFGFARVSDGTGVIDPTFAANYAGMRAAGLARGAWQYFEPAQDPVAQANLLLQKIPVPLEQGDLPPALDVEITGNQTPETIAANVQAWVAIVQAATGKMPIILTGAYYWNDDVQSSALADYPLWVVQFSDACPNLPTAWDGWLFWLHSYSGAVDGITGPVDLDTFNGSAQQLQALVENDRLFVDGFESSY